MTAGPTWTSVCREELVSLLTTLLPRRLAYLCRPGPASPRQVVVVPPALVPPRHFLHRVLAASDQVSQVIIIFISIITIYVGVVSRFFFDEYYLLSFVGGGKHRWCKRKILGGLFGVLFFRVFFGVLLFGGVIFWVMACDHVVGLRWILVL